MRIQKIGFDLVVFQSFKELPEDGKRLMEHAVAARKNAYVPYSNFQVGAAVLMENGKMVTGNNQENASYPSGLCAERVAVFYAGAKYPGVFIRAIAITGTPNAYKGKVPVAPCGNCRQAILEYETRQQAPIQVFFMGEEGEVYNCGTMANLLPLGFNGSCL